MYGHDKMRMKIRQVIMRNIIGNRVSRSINIVTNIILKIGWSFYISSGMSSSNGKLRR